ncbi:hypothetical protein JM83_1351 [Gillisia sp. Hel_I_86]|uniref:hypothetical protein n=1 Tax=Gillisia sp. Hel_I_86 TaxID=1249981 RepID=UPI00119BCAA6|nr:hypothetical protein [Gillisia sp. Hel_I_86]TVZ26394.1 hypothetical protein JM83_1351 [Gillisia sp. Hel_I_86]
MENASVLMGIGLLALFVGPILYMIVAHAAKEKRTLKLLNKLAAQHQMKLDQIEVTNSLLLGLDSSSKKFLVIDPKDHSKYDVIDLKNVSQSTVSKSGHQQKIGNKSKLALTHIGLELLKNNSKEKIKEVVFYDENDNDSMDADAQLFIANKWDNLIRKNLSA